MPIPYRYLVRKWSSSSFPRILFLGTDDFSLGSLKAIQDNVSYEELHVAYAESSRSKHPLRDYAKLKGLKAHLWPCSDIKKGDYDLGVVASFGHLLPKRFISKFSLGIINVHGSLLPRWRGASPVVHAILHGDTETGITIMNVAPHRFDKGNILAQKSCPIDPDVTSKELLNRLSLIGGELIVQVLNDYEKYKENSVIQNNDFATKAPLIKSRDIFYINWSAKTSQQIYNQWRALNDIDLLRCTWKNRRKEDVIVKFSKNRPRILSDDHIALKWIPWATQNETNHLKPGVIIYLQRYDSIAVKAQRDWILFSSLQLGTKTLSARDFFNGYLDSHRVPFYFN